MLGYAKTKALIIIQATQDEVIGEAKYGNLSSLADISKIASDHNFTGDNRKVLIKKISNILQK